MSALTPNPGLIEERDAARAGAAAGARGRPRPGRRAPCGRAWAPPSRPSCARSCSIELRTLAVRPRNVLFAISTFVVFHFALNRGRVGGDLAAGILVVTLLLASLLGINRLFVADAEQGGFDGFLLAPVDGAAMLIAKALALLAYLVVLEVVAVAGVRAASARPLARRSAARGCVLVLVLADIGIARRRHARRGARRALAGARPARPAARAAPPDPDRDRRRERARAALEHAAPALGAWFTGTPARWLATLALYDLLFGLIAYALFDFLLED